MIRYQITDGEHVSPVADLVQIRPGDLAMARRAMLRHPRVIVNDRTDIALALKAAGVHLRSRSIAPARLRQILPAGFLITVACHSETDVLEAVGADFALLSPVFSPLSKLDSRRPLGLEALSRICRIAPMPVLALGGITEANAAECIGAGAAGIAGISLFLRG